MAWTVVNAPGWVDAVVSSVPVVYQRTSCTDLVDHVGYRRLGRRVSSQERCAARSPREP